MHGSVPLRNSVGIHSSPSGVRSEIANERERSGRESEEKNLVKTELDVSFPKADCCGGPLSKLFELCVYAKSTLLARTSVKDYSLITAARNRV